MTSKLTRLTDDELTETLRLATSGYPLPAWVEGNLRQAFAELQERRKADSEPVAWIHSNNDIGIPAITVSQKIGHYWMAEFENVQPLYRHAQPAKGLELAGWQFKSVNGDWLGLIDEHGKNQAAREGCEVREVFAMADGVNDREQVRCEHAEWSQATFGDVGPVGPLKHLSKEALEAAAEPGDLSEWADMQFLLWDAQRRAGITDEQITKAMIEKLAVNKLRDWPEPKDGEPRLHIKEQPAPVVLKDHEIRELVNQLRDIAIKYHGTGQLRERIAHVIRGAMLQAGNSPVIPDGYVMVPVKPTMEILDEFDSIIDYGAEDSEVAWRRLLAAAPQEVNHG